MRIFLLSFFLFFVFVFQISFLPAFSTSWAVPNALFVLLIFLSFSRFDFRELMILTFFVGVLSSIYSGSVFGAVLLAILISIFLINFLAYNFFGKANFFVFCSGVAIGSIFYEFFYFIILKLYELFKISSMPIFDFNLFIKIFAISVVSNVLLATVIYLPLKKIGNLIGINK